ncbi:DUF6463 family protein [Catellatospora sp. NPDC049609]|uniref:DUF6463 family protein n=1 Tax=Catellatospora sp. NPDC049609 TaxID=3155505 RepID=UPI00342238D6
MAIHRRRKLRWASGIMVFLGAGHLCLLAAIAWGDVVGWAERGWWAAVPLAFGGDTVTTVASLQNKVTFWSGPASFAVPLVLLGCLLWHLSGRGVAVPAAIGWTLAAWCALAGIILVPSPFFLGIVSGLLIVLAARHRTPQGAAPEAPGVS